MPKKLTRRYGTTNLHFITFSCYRRLPFLRTVRTRNVFLIVLNDVRGRYQFTIVGYVVMPEHVHLLLSEPKKGNPSLVVQVLKQRVSRRLWRRTRTGVSARQFSTLTGCCLRTAQFLAEALLRLQCVEPQEADREVELHAHESGEARFGGESKLWPWSSYQYGEENLCTPDRLSGY
jgi:REP element-mobilizing transposase RayT